MYVVGDLISKSFHDIIMYFCINIMHENVESVILDDVLWIDFFAAILIEAFRTPDHKTFFLVLF